jgi:hypothetical protein
MTAGQFTSTFTCIHGIAAEDVKFRTDDENALHLDLDEKGTDIRTDIRPEYSDQLERDRRGLLALAAAATEMAVRIGEIQRERGIIPSLSYEPAHRPGELEGWPMTTSTPKTPTASGISRLLATAGFERSESSATRIKGWRNHSEGYVVSGHGAGEVQVEHKTGYDRGPNAAKRRDETLGEYAVALAVAGYSVERDETWALPRLIVTAKEDWLMAGAYCKFCGRRCFVLRVIPDGPEKGWAGHLATCQGGMAYDLKVMGHTHLTAVNPITDPEAAARIAAEVRAGWAVTVAQLIDHLRAMPPGATAVDGDELEVISVMASQDLATVTIWTEQK